MKLVPNTVNPITDALKNIEYLKWFFSITLKFTIFLSEFLQLNSITAHKFKNISTIMNQEYHFKYKGVEYDASDWA